MRLAVFLLLLMLGSAAADAKKRTVRKAAPVSAPAPDTGTADRLFVNGDYDGAIASYTALLAHPRFPAGLQETAFLNRGYAQLRLRRFDAAAADLRQAIALNPAGEEAAAALYAVQNRDAKAAPAGSDAPAPATPIWGALVRLPGRIWIASTTKPVMHLRYSWGRLGITLPFYGQDAQGHPIEGQYYIDPNGNGMKLSYFYRGKATLSDVDVTASALTVLPGEAKAREREVTTLQSDGTFNVLKQKRKGKEWETVSVGTLMPGTEQMVASLDWPDAPPVSAAAEKKPSFFKSMLSSMKEGALLGFRDGMAQGIGDATTYRVRQATGTKGCKLVTGEIVKCP